MDDIAAKRGAPKVDPAPQGTTLRKLVRLSDLEPVPAKLVALYENTTPPEGEDLVFKPANTNLAAVGM